MMSDGRFARLIAENAAAALPLLEEQLKSELDEVRQLKILAVLSQMPTEELRGRKDIARLAVQVAAEMTGGWLERLNGDDRKKEYAKELAETIRLKAEG